MKSLISICLMVLMTIGTYAQNKKSSESPMTAEKSLKADKSPEERAQRLADRMAKNLELTEDQKASVYNAALEMHQSNQVAKEDRKETMKSSASAFDTKMAEILNENQLKKYEASKKNAKGKMKKMRQNRGLRGSQEP